MSSPGPAAPMRSLMRTFACAIAALALSFVARITDPNDASAARESPFRKLFIDLVKSLFCDEAAFFGWLGPPNAFSGVPSGENGDWTEAGGCPPPGGAFGWGLWASNVAADSAAVIAAASSTSTSANPFSPTPALAPPNPFGGARPVAVKEVADPPAEEERQAPSRPKPNPFGGATPVAVKEVADPPAEESAPLEEKVAALAVEE